MSDLRPVIYEQTIRHLFAPVAGLLFAEPTVTEVLINGPKHVYYESKGKLIEAGPECHFADEHALLAAVRNVAEFVHRRIGGDAHSMDARLPEPHKFRVHVIVPPSSRNGVCVSIRKFSRNETRLPSLIAGGSLTEEAGEYLRIAVRSHRNLLVSGGTGSGKTTLLNALSAAIDPAERIVVIEDSSKLQLVQPHAVYLEAKPPEPDGTGAVTIRDLFVDSLRMRPDRILVGEVRRGEALDLIQSMLSGHDGSLSTVHASSPALALVRLETLCLMNESHMPVHVARTQVASAVQVVVQVARFPDGSRRVRSVAEVRGLDAKDRYRVRTLFQFVTERIEPDKTIIGKLQWTGKPSWFGREVLQMFSPEEISLTKEIWRLQKNAE